MFHPTLRIFTVAASIVTAVTAHAVTVTSVKTTNLNQDSSGSPWFSSSPDGLTTFTEQKIDNTGQGQVVTFKPDGTVQAGTVNSLTTIGAFTINGTSTAAGNWTDGNGVPTGIKLTFNTSVTFSVGAGSPTGSLLTATGNSGAAFGNGIAITQTANAIGAIDGVPAGTIESLDVTAMTVSNINFTGMLTDTNYTFTPGTVGNFGPYVLRTANNNNANGFVEDTEVAGLFSASVPPDPSGEPTIGFGGPTGTSFGDNTPGDGTVAGHLAMENSFAQQTINGHSNFFPRQIGAWTLKMLNGSIGIKGIGYEYDITFDITPAAVPLTGDYNGNGTVDAADYVLWREGDLSADSNGDLVVDQVDYDTWQANFGNTSTPGSGSLVGGGAVPEPTVGMLAALGVIGVFASLRRTHR